MYIRAFYYSNYSLRPLTLVNCLVTANCKILLGQSPHCFRKVALIQKLLNKLALFSANVFTG